ncbi:MAG: hypothetical protein A3F92_02835 [Candidatus Rokubacteria bacterium RIFCSPLOWO2_12_FULL_71_22]|nr:MAG: hypothetical protein A3F92_02835 [Candidatus Rokubacteria bacterium RIFCSPLOWO2_12_FULL_71_22]
MLRKEDLTMLRNDAYDLMETASVLSKGLHRYTTFQKDAKSCPQCQQLWTYMRQTDEEQLKRILMHLKQHFDKEVEVKLASA